MMYKSIFFMYNSVVRMKKDPLNQYIMQFTLLRNIVAWMQCGGRMSMTEKEIGRQNGSLESILIESIHTLVYEKDINEALNCFLRTICGFYQAERGYIFELDEKRQFADNTFEWCAEGIETEKNRLQGVSVSILSNWMKRFREAGGFYIKELEADVPQDRADFEILKSQGINSLMAAPLLRDDEIVGFLGVDNPAEHIGDMAMLRSVADFVTADLEKRRLIEELRRVGCIDMLTGLKNRNEYIRRLNELKNTKLNALGITFIDINGLKLINDTYGHECGDDVIRETAECIRKFAPERAYRIGGDEFIIFWENVEEAEFYEKVEKMKTEFKVGHEYSISMGNVWQEGNVDIEQQVKKADTSMYEAKQAHYQNENHDRRKRS